MPEAFASTRDACVTPRTTLAQHACVTKRLLNLASAILIGCLLLPGCAYLSKNGRQQMAYQRYVKKCMKMKYRRQAKIYKQQQRIPHAPKTKWEVTASKTDSPDTSEPTSATGEQSAEQQ
jgi:hypothetical protein